MVFKGEVGGGWRLKGCGELKRGLKNYQQRRAGTLPVVGERERDRERQRERKRERESEANGMKRRSGREAREEAGCSVKSEPLRSLGTFFPV